MADNITENHLPRENNSTEAEMSLFDKAALDATRVTYLTAENARFTDHDGYVTLNFGGEEKRALLHLLFPYDSPDANISVLDEENREIGIIAKLSDFDGDSLAAIKKEIGRKYYVREITKIVELRDRHGITFWRVKCSDNPENIVEFSLRDTYGSMFHLSDVRVIISDTDGNRFSITDVTKLDKSSYRKIELYL